MRLTYLARLILALGFLSGCRVLALADPIPITAGLKLTGPAVIKPGDYHLSDFRSGIVQVSGRNFTIDFQGARIVGPGTGAGIGIHVTDARNVTIKNADVSGCLWGIVVERCRGVRLLNCVTSWNADLPPGTIIDESGREPEDNHGGGILIRDSRNGLVERCISQHQWDGIDVVRSEGNVIENGDYSYNGNWGLHLWDSSNNTFRGNRAIWCTTGAGKLYQALTGWQTYDSQAVGIDHNSNENLIEANDLRFGGDGIFIRANEGPIAPGTVVPPRNGSHRNILRGNDCSFSPNNAIEVDLVDDTIIEGNNCSYSNYGMWLGYSRRCKVRNNLCIDDSSHAVEIENGQSDLFENNIFGFDTPRPDGQLIYLRQNGRDKTPSGPYRLVGNLFYGAKTGVLLKATKATLKNNILKWDEPPQAHLVYGDAASSIAQNRNRIQVLQTGSTPTIALDGVEIHPGETVTIRKGAARLGPFPPLIEIDGIPVWVRRTTAESVTFRMPSDFWDRPAQETAPLRVLTLQGWTVPLGVKIAWPSDHILIDSITPDPAKIGDAITITGAGLMEGSLLLNGKPVTITAQSPTMLTFTLPVGILTTTRYNVLFERGSSARSVDAWPITFRVQVPDEQMPHLISATFSPATLHVGDLLKVTFMVRNNLPTPASLMTQPKPPFTYDAKQSWDEIGVQEIPGTLHLRVTSDHPGNHDPGSWPYLFGFGQDSLAPGETTTVVGYIKVQTPGEHEYRVGLVASGVRFIDDNAFRTKITVLP